MGLEASVIGRIKKKSQIKVKKKSNITAFICQKSEWASRSKLRTLTCTILFLTHSSLGARVYVTHAVLLRCWPPNANPTNKATTMSIVLNKHKTRRALFYRCSVRDIIVVLWTSFYYNRYQWLSTKGSLFSVPPLFALMARCDLFNTLFELTRCLYQ